MFPAWLSRQACRCGASAPPGNPRAAYWTARALPADLVVLGSAGRRGPGQPYIGHHTQHILEFAEWPVLTVPAPA